MPPSIEATRIVTMHQLLSRPLRIYFETLMIEGHKEVSQPGHVPIDTGTLRNTLAPGAGVTSVDKADPPMWAKVGTKLSPYPGVLEAGSDKRGRVYHYAGGPSAGKETKGWLAQTIPNMQSARRDALKELAHNLEAAWRG